MEETVESPVVKEENEDESNVITLAEFIEEETRLETDADAVLGPSDDKNCTYNLGYMGRQALYACKTCKGEDGAKVAGVCLACTYHCHEGHDLIELYTKRNFRCDCGNSRFKERKCNLEPNKENENLNNKYNHNFEGSYCTCKRPYPDPENSVPDEMIQCIVCEDWYHTRHLHADLPSEENYAEMICCECTERLSFLNNYLGYSVTKVVKDEPISVDVVKNGNSTTSATDSSIKEGLINPQEGNSVASIPNGIDKSANKSEAVMNGDKVPNEEKGDIGISVPNGESTGKIQCDVKEQPSGSSIERSSDNTKKTGCLLKSLKEINREKKGATFWPQNFRTLLCACDSCKEMYVKLEISYLVDMGDTVQSYEEKGRNKLSSTDQSKHSIDRVLGMLSNIGMDRFSQAEAILNYNDLKSNLTAYLLKFAENKKVVREEDIHEFFTQMKARKRQKLDHSFSCR